MDKINPAAYITDTDPAIEAVANTSDWYEWQYLNISDGSQIPWLLAQGWRIYRVVSSGGTAYEWGLKRRVLRPERALADLVSSFTSAYNEGRSLNDQRYDEIVALYSVMLDKTEDSLNSLETDDTSYDTLVESIITELREDNEDFNDDIDGIFDDFGDSERTRIETQFDNQLAAARASAIDRGVYNTTVWDSISAGIERERAVANTDLEDKLLERQLAVKDRAYTLKADLLAKILAARDRLRQQIHNLDLQRVGLRNQVLSAMLNFMERRTDGYPDLSAIGQLTASLGAGEAATYTPS